jgi:hypothetical protein
LQKQEQLYRNLVKVRGGSAQREFLLRENIEHLQEEVDSVRADMAKLSLANQDLTRLNEQLALEKQQLINRRNLEMCEKDLVINVFLYSCRNWSRVLGLCNRVRRISQKKQKLSSIIAVKVMNQ